MKSLDISFSRLEDAGARVLSECIYNIDGLRLCECSITEEGVNALAIQIKKRNTPVY